MRDSIEDAIEVQKLDTDLYASKKLWKPLTGRGAFGGQVAAQATMAANDSVDLLYGLHSMHVYFLTFGDVSKQIIYHVRRLRDGKSYCTRSVRATQSGQTIFAALFSFQRQETLIPNPPSYYSTPPTDILAPEDSSLEESRYEAYLDNEKLSSKLKEFWMRALEERKQSSTEIRDALVNENDIPHRRTCWMRTQSAQTETDPRKKAALSKAILTYVSDFQLIGVAGKALNLPKERRISMMSSTDHSIHFYHPIDTSQYFLYDMTADAVDQGRGLVSGRIFNEKGELAAVVRQEGVIRVEERERKAKL